MAILIHQRSTQLIHLPVDRTLHLIQICLAVAAELRLRICHELSDAKAHCRIEIEIIGYVVIVALAVIEGLPAEVAEHPLVVSRLRTADIAPLPVHQSCL